MSYAIGVESICEISSREANKMINDYDKGKLSLSVLEARTADDCDYIAVHLPNEIILYNISLGEKMKYEFAWSILRHGPEGTHSKESLLKIIEDATNTETLEKK